MPRCSEHLTAALVTRTRALALAGSASAAVGWGGQHTLYTTSATQSNILVAGTVTVVAVGLDEREDSQNSGHRWVERGCADHCEGVVVRGLGCSKWLTMRERGTGGSLGDFWRAFIAEPLWLLRKPSLERFNGDQWPWWGRGQR